MVIKDEFSVFADFVENATAMSALPTFTILGGRLPDSYGVLEYGWKSQVSVEETDQSIVVSGPIHIVIDKTAPRSKKEHALDDDELEFPCLIQDKIQGTAAFYKDGRIRCDSIDALEFWFEMVRV